MFNSIPFRLIGHAAFVLCMGPYIFNARGEAPVDGAVPSALHEDAASASLYANESGDAVHRMTDAPPIATDMPSGATVAGKRALFGNSVYNPTPCRGEESGHAER